MKEEFYEDDDTEWRIGQCLRGMSFDDAYKKVFLYLDGHAIQDGEKLFRLFNLLKSRGCYTVYYEDAYTLIDLLRSRVYPADYH